MDINNVQIDSLCLHSSAVSVVLDPMKKIQIKLKILPPVTWIPLLSFY